jgi:HPt (histidine-containing phosphotransfer) domain-containing protein
VPRAEDDAVPTDAVLAAAVLDGETVEELRDLGDEGFAHLYRQYLAGLDTMVAAILAAVGPEALPSAPDEDGSLHRLAHKLKGSSAAMGATALAAVCSRLEDAGEGGTDAGPAGLGATLRALQAESDRVRAAVATLLPS